MKKLSVFIFIALLFISLPSADKDIYINSGNYGYLKDNVIRLHILADGNDDISQEIKLMVRDRVLDEFSDEMRSFSSKTEAEKNVAALTGEIEEFVNDFLAENNVSYGCGVSLGKSIFPDRNYSSLYFPAGEYTALKITLGSGEGNNWWCVMYPPLCFAEIYDDEDLPDDITEVRWKIAEWWEGLWE